MRILLIIPVRNTRSCYNSRHGPLFLSLLPVFRASVWPYQLNLAGLLPRKSIHYVRSHGVFHALENIVAGMDQLSVLKDEHSAGLGRDVKAVSRSRGVESGGSTFKFRLDGCEMPFRFHVAQCFLAWGLGVVQVEM